MNKSAFSGNLAKYLEKNAKLLPDSYAVLFQYSPNIKKTFAQLNDDVINCATFFRKRGVQKRERSLVLLKPGYNLIVSCFALLYIGAIPVIIDPGMGLKSLLNCIKRTNPKNLIAIPIARSLALLFNASFSSIKTKISVNSKFEETLNNYSNTEKTEIYDSKDYELAAIVFTSGSTGKPKGVRYLNLNFSAQIEVLKQEFGITEGEVDLVTLPVFSLFNPALGVTSVIPQMNPRKPAKASAKTIVDAIQNFKITSAFCSPVIGKKVSSYCEDLNIDLPFMKRMMLAGAPSTPKLITSLSKRLPNGKIIVPYGATEALPVSYSCHDQIKNLSNSIIEGGGSNLGIGIKGISILIMPIRNSPLPNENEDFIVPIKEKLLTGEICVAGNVVTDGYDQMPGATRDARFVYNSKEYHRMGDLGYWDENGNLRFMGRKAECIQTANGRIETERYEPFVNSLPGIQKSALIGIGEGALREPCLVVVPTQATKKVLRSTIEKVRSSLLAKFPEHNINRIFIQKNLPVDARHNAKIHRLTLGKIWTAKVSKNAKLGLIP